MREKMTVRQREYRRICRELMNNPKCAECGKNVMFEDYEYIQNSYGTSVFHRECLMQRLRK